MFNKIWNFWNDMKVPLGIIVGFTVVLAFYGWWWLAVGLAAIGCFYWYARRQFLQQRSAV